MRVRCETCKYFDFRGPGCHLDPPRLVGMNAAGNELWRAIKTTKDTVACRHHINDEWETDAKE